MKRKNKIFLIITLILMAIAILNIKKINIFGNIVNNLTKLSSNNSVDITEYITAVDITDAEGNPIEKISEINTNNMVSNLVNIKISFEIPTKLFKDGEEWHGEASYQLPSSLIVNDINTDKSIYDEEGNIVGNYDINDDGLVSITIEKGPLSSGTIIKLEVDYWGRVDFSTTNHSGVMGVNFNDDISYDVYVERTPEISIIKNRTTGYEYNESNSSLEADFEIIVSSISGTDKTISLVETTGGFTSVNYDNVKIELVDENNNTTDITDNVSYTNFANLELPALKPGNKYVVSYKMSGAVSSTYKGQVSVSNKATASTILNSGSTLRKEASKNDYVYYEGVDYSTIAIQKQKRDLTPEEDDNYIYQTYRITADLYNVKENIEITDTINAYTKIYSLNVEIENVKINGTSVDYDDYLQSILEQDSTLNTGQTEAFKMVIPGTGVNTIVIDYKVYASKEEDYKFSNIATLKDSKSTINSNSSTFEYIKPQPELPEISIVVESTIDDATCDYDDTRDVTVTSTIYFNTNNAPLTNSDNRLNISTVNSAIEGVEILVHDEYGNIVESPSYNAEEHSLLIEDLISYYSYEIKVTYSYNTSDEEFSDAYHAVLYYGSSEEPSVEFEESETIYIEKCDLDKPDIAISAVKTKYNCLEDRLENSSYTVTINSNNMDLTNWNFRTDNLALSFKIDIYDGLDLVTKTFENFNKVLNVIFEEAGNGKMKIKINNEYLEGTYAKTSKIVYSVTGFSDLAKSTGSLIYNDLEPQSVSVNIERESSSVCEDNIEFEFIDSSINSSCNGNSSLVTSETNVDINTANSSLAGFKITLGQSSSNNIFDNTIKTIRLYTDEYDYTITDLNDTAYDINFVSEDDEHVKISGTDYIFNKDDKIHMYIYTEDIISNQSTDELGYTISATYSGDDKGSASYVEAYSLKVCSPIVSVTTYSYVESCYLGRATLQYVVKLQKPSDGSVDWDGTTIRITDENIEKIELSTGDSNVVAIGDMNEIILSNSTNPDNIRVTDDLEIPRNTNTIILYVTIERDAYSYDYIYPNSTVKVERNNEVIFQKTVNNSYYTDYCYNNMDTETEIYKDYSSTKDEGNNKIITWTSTVSNTSEKTMRFKDTLGNDTISVSGVPKPLHYMTYDQVANIQIETDTHEYETMDPSIISVIYRVVNPDTGSLSGSQTAYLLELTDIKDNVYIYEFEFLSAYKNLSLRYDTTYDTTYINTNTSYYVYNYLEVTNTSNSKNYTYSRSVTIRKKDTTDTIRKDVLTSEGQLVSGINNIPYEEGNTYMYYHLTVNKNSYLTTGGTIKDVLPEGTTLVQSEWNYGGINCSGTSYCKNGLYVRFGYTGNDTFRTTYTYSYVNYTYNENTRELNISIPYYTYYYNYPVYIYYKVKVVEAVEDDTSYTNKAILTSNNEEIESNEVTNTVLINKLRKNYDSYSSHTNELSYHFVFNKNDIFTLNLSLPDNASIYVEYALEVEYKNDEPLYASLENIVRLADPTLTYAYSRTNILIKENYSQVLAATNAIALNLLKVDSKNTEVKLKGAKFSLEIQDENDWVKIGEIETSADGKALLSQDRPILVNKLYRLKELSAPLGYELNDEYQYFYYESNMFNQTSPVTGIELLDIVDYTVTVKDEPIEDNSSVVNPNTKTTIRVIVFILFTLGLLFLLNKTDILRIVFNKKRAKITN